MREPGLVFAAADVTASGSQRPRGRGRSRWLRAAGLAAEWQELSSTPGDPRLCWGGGVWDQAPRAGWHCARVSRRLVRDGMALAERGTPGRTRSRVRFSGGNHPPGTHGAAATWRSLVRAAACRPRARSCRQHRSCGDSGKAEGDSLGDTRFNAAQNGQRAEGRKLLQDEEWGSQCCAGRRPGLPPPPPRPPQPTVG